MYWFDKQCLQEAKKINWKTNPVITAHHEAGHAVACMLLKIKFSYVIVYKRRETTQGCVVFKNRFTGLKVALIKRDVSKIKRYMIMFMCGDIATQWCLLQNFNITSENTNMDDVVIEDAVIEDLMSHGSLSEQDFLDDDDIIIESLRKHISLSEQDFLDLYSLACDLLEENWLYVLKVAWKLQEERKLKYFQVRNLSGGFL